MINAESEEQRRDEILANAVEELKVHFDTIVIIATKRIETDGNVETQLYSNHAGYWYEKYGALKAIVNKFDRDSIESML